MKKRMKMYIRPKKKKLELIKIIIILNSFKGGAITLADE
jgi:hypothetical protein